MSRPLAPFSIGAWKRNASLRASSETRQASGCTSTASHSDRGRQECRVPLSVVPMIDAPEVLAPYVRDFAYTLHDLGRIAPERLSRDPEVRSALVTLAVATTTDMGPRGSRSDRRGPGCRRRDGTCYSTVPGHSEGPDAGGDGNFAQARAAGTMGSADGHDGGNMD